ncbi:hypothetical protein [Streptomyces sp. NPDC056304]|uniref:hypothetical protein n=1 Tax=Streptomyces sp. NPDC056304 TaxID=3345778 RepID=UPI0035DBD069
MTTTQESVLLAPAADARPNVRLQCHGAFTETVYTADGLPFVHPDNQFRAQEGARP